MSQHQEPPRDEVKRVKLPDRVIADYLRMTMRTEGETEYVLASDHDAALAAAVEAQREQDATVLDEAAIRLIGGKARVNKVDQHTAAVLREKAAAIRAQGQHD